MTAAIETRSADEALDQVLGTLRASDRSDSQENDADNCKPWVLCVDDDPEFSECLSTRLGASGIGVINALDGMDGYSTAFKCSPDAIILDYNMPNGRGDRVLRQLKVTVATQDIPVIVLTGRPEPEIRVKMLSFGAAAFFTKPVDFPALVQEVLRLSS